MKDLIEHLAKYWSFLWVAGRYRITDSTVSTHFGGDAVLVIVSEALRLRFVRDRGQLFLDVQPSWAGKTAEWYSVDLVYRLVTGQRQESAELNKEYVDFARVRLPEIESLFSHKEAFRASKAKLDELKNLRAKEMFG
ncbi:MAG TPA: hypothetical protein VK453_10135 [Micromonosporaceae bacterium]|nr:hypothetical protein [Micromonosporaceae bacterium]